MCHLPPANVYTELKEYGKQAHDLFTSDGELELALLKRGDPLILLGLAQFGHSQKVAEHIYKLSQSAATEDNYALRLAVLSNPSISIYGVVGDEGLLQFLNSDEHDEESYTVLRNPASKGILASLFNGKPPFDQIKEDRLTRALMAAYSNPAINSDESDEHGPDFAAWDLQEGIRHLLETLPLNEHNARAIYWLLSDLNPRRASPFRQDPYPVIARWQGLEYPAENGDYRVGICSNVEFPEELCCLMAALYGSYYFGPDHKTVKVGALDGTNRLVRCGAYANERMKPDQMQQAYDRDEDVFVLAALCNEQLFWNRATRAKLEELIGGDLARLYKKRCEEIRSRNPSFDLTPVSEDGAPAIEDEHDETSESEARKRTQRIEAMVDANSKRLAKLETMLTWTLLIVVAATIFSWRHTS